MCLAEKHLLWFSLLWDLWVPNIPWTHLDRSGRLDVARVVRTLFFARVGVGKTKRSVITSTNPSQENRCHHAVHAATFTFHFTHSRHISPLPAVSSLVWSERTRSPSAGADLGDAQARRRLAADKVGGGLGRLGEESEAEGTWRRARGGWEVEGGPVPFWTGGKRVLTKKVRRRHLGRERWGKNLLATSRREDASAMDVNCPSSDFMMRWGKWKPEMFTSQT